MDGIDVALIETDGENVFSLGPAHGTLHPEAGTIDPECAW